MHLQKTRRCCRNNRLGSVKLLLHRIGIYRGGWFWSSDGGCGLISDGRVELIAWTLESPFPAAVSPNSRSLSREPPSCSRRCQYLPEHWQLFAGQAMAGGDLKRAC